MCKDCKETNDATKQTLMSLQNTVKGLANALQYAPTENYEYGDPQWVGGVKGVYAVRAPFQGDCQFHVESATAGATASLVIVSPFRLQNAPDLVGTNQSSYSENSSFPGVVLQVPASTTVTVIGTWYNVVDSENCVYVLITAASNAAGANIQFRQKR